MSEQKPRTSSDNDARQLMIVDDEPELLKSLIALFEKQYMVVFAPNGAKALELLEQGFTPQVILSDNRMPGISGVEFLAKSSDYVPDAVKVIMSGFSDIRDILTAISQGRIYMYLNKPWQVADIMQAIRVSFNHYQVTAQMRRLTADLAQRNELIQRLNEEISTLNHKLLDVNHEVYGDLLSTVSAIGSLLGHYDRGHYYVNPAESGALWAAQIGPLLGLTGDKLSHLLLATWLRDIGEVDLPAHILGKIPERLGAEDLAIYQTHVERAVTLLQPIERLHRAAEIIGQHHERIDGSGFPQRLSSYQVMREAQIVGLIDLYLDLVYRIDPPLLAISDAPPVQDPAELSRRQTAAGEVIKNLGHQFDAEVIAAFISLAQSGSCPGLLLPG